MKLYYNIDWDKMVKRREREYIVAGWVATEGNEEVKLLVKLDGNYWQDVEVTFLEREDVKSAIKELKDNRQDIGFDVVIRKLGTICQEHENLEIVGVVGEEEEVIFSKPVSELKTQFEQEELEYHLDVLTRRGEEMVIQGWAVDGAQEDSISLFDGGEKSLEVEVKRYVRRDVLEAFGVEKDYKYGFEMHFPREIVKSNQLLVRFSMGKLSRELWIDMQKFDKDNTSFGRVMNVLALSNFKNNCRYIRDNGMSQFVSVLKSEFSGVQDQYEIWRKEHELTKKQINAQKKKVFQYCPLISISIPLYNTPLEYLEELLQSVCRQTYGNWELCLADGSTNEAVREYITKNYSQEKRIKYKRLEKNEGIAGNTNEAVSMASGDFIMLTDHDDTLAINALYEMVKALNEDTSLDIIYTDEDLVDATGTIYSSPRFKPDFNFDFLRSINYICHIFMVRKSIMDEAGGFREGYDGAQDYDLILRCCEKTDRIHHIPLVLYHWRAHPDSTAGNPESKMYAIEAGKKALEEHYQRMGIDAEVEYTGIFIMFRTIMKIKNEPKVSVIIPNKDHIADLDKCICSILEKTSYKNYEIIVVENNSTEEETFSYYEKLQRAHDNIKVVVWEKEFNYSKINNFGVQFAKGEYYILLNNDIEVISETWMSEMLGYCQRDDVGAVGAKLYYPDDTVQHAGIVIGVGGFAGHILTGSKRGENGYFGRLSAIQDISAVTAACLMIKRSVFEEIGGFDEEFGVALNDVDLCMKVRDTGKLIIFNPWVEMYHYESKSRGFEDTPEKVERFKSEIKRFRDKWKAILENGDPYYNVNLTLDRGDCSVRRKDERFEIVEEIERENEV